MQKHVRPQIEVEGLAVGELVARAAQIYRELLEKELGSIDSTRTQYLVLRTIGQHEGCSQTEIVDRTGVDRSTLADVAGRLTAKGLAKRKRTKADARAYAIELTASGKALLAKLRAAADRADHKIGQALGRHAPRLREDLAAIARSFPRARGEP